MKLSAAGVPALVARLLPLPDALFLRLARRLERARLPPPFLTVAELRAGIAAAR